MKIGDKVIAVAAGRRCCCSPVLNRPLNWLRRSVNQLAIPKAVLVNLKPNLKACRPRIQRNVIRDLVSVLRGLRIEAVKPPN